MSVIEAAKQEVLAQLRDELPALIANAVAAELDRREAEAAAKAPTNPTPAPPVRPAREAKPSAAGRQ
jgi:hypothetical protein